MRHLYQTQVPCHSSCHRFPAIIKACCRRWCSPGLLDRTETGRPSHFGNPAAAAPSTQAPMSIFGNTMARPRWSWTAGRHSANSNSREYISFPRSSVGMQPVTLPRHVSARGLHQLFDRELRYIASNHYAALKRRGLHSYAELLLSSSLAKCIARHQQQDKIDDAVKGATRVLGRRSADHPADYH